MPWHTYTVNFLTYRIWEGKRLGDCDMERPDKPAKKQNRAAKSKSGGLKASEQARGVSGVETSAKGSQTGEADAD